MNTATLQVIKPAALSPDSKPDTLRESFMIFYSFLDNSPSPAWIGDEEGYIIFMNRPAQKIWGIDDSCMHKHLYDVFPRRIARRFLVSDRKVIETGKPLIFIEESLRKDGSKGVYMLHKFLLEVPSCKRLIAGQAIDITEEQHSKEELRRHNERFHYVAKATSDCIWDWNMETGHIYRSESLLNLAGYSTEEIGHDINWWYEKTHPDDRDRVMSKINHYILKKNNYCQDEYRFLCADNSYRIFMDNGYFIFDGDKPLRAIGVVKDITEKRKLEAELIHQKVQKQKQISQVIIATQDQERNDLAIELHDNVNQLLSSACLMLGCAKSSKDIEYEALDKGRQYIQMAIAEIRNITRHLSSSFIQETGLQNAIEDIANNMRMGQQIAVLFEYDLFLEKVMSDDQNLMVYRIIQEQTNNIMKYAAATEVTIVVRKHHSSLFLAIRDNGKGFDMQAPRKGIGLTNIRNRVEVVNGNISIRSAPGSGCAIEIMVPLKFS